MVLATGGWRKINHVTSILSFLEMSSPEDFILAVLAHAGDQILLLGELITELTNDGGIACATTALQATPPHGAGEVVTQLLDGFALV